MMKSNNFIFTTFFLLLSTNAVLGQLVDGCWGPNANFIRQNEMRRDLKTPYTYIICPGTTFTPGTLVSNGQQTSIEGGSFPIQLKSRARIQCGENGDPEDECIIDGTGTYGMWLEPFETIGPFSVWDAGKPNLKNVEFVGMTFDSFSVQGERQTMISLVATHGQITFEKCKFQFSDGAEPLFSLNYLAGTGKDLDIAFNKCKFEGITLPEEFTTDGGINLFRFGGFTLQGQILLPADTNINVVFDRTTFFEVSTNLAADREGISRSIINFQSSGKLTLKDVCFENMALSTNGYSDVVLVDEGAEYELKNVYYDTESTLYFPEGTTPECGFTSTVKSEEDGKLERIGCGLEPDVDFCTADITSAPVVPPTKAPVVPPTAAPISPAPTNAPVPTLSPTDSPTPPPVETSPPTNAPTPSPTTSAPTPSPTNAPTSAPAPTSAASSLSKFFLPFPYVALVAWFFV